MAGDEVGLIDEISRLYRFGTEAQMRNGKPAGFLGVIVKISLNIQIRIIAYYFNGIFICAYGTV